MVFGSMLLKVLRHVSVFAMKLFKNKMTFNILLETPWSFNLSCDRSCEHGRKEYLSVLLGLKF